MAYLITGRAGSGKSTICLELRRRHQSAFDADEVPGLARWIDRQTGQITKVDHSRYIDYGEVSWDWDAAVMDDFISHHPSSFLCGSASNQLSFHDRFRQVFMLDLDPDEHRRRLTTRQNSDYAKDSRQIDEIIVEQQKLTEQALAMGAILIDARQPLGQVVDNIVRQSS